MAQAAAARQGPSPLGETITLPGGIMLTSNGTGGWDGLFWTETRYPGLQAEVLGVWSTINGSSGPPLTPMGIGSPLISNGQNALDVFGGLAGAAQGLLVSGDNWAGINGKYYSKNWGGNQYSGPRAAAYKAARGYRTFGRMAVAGTIILGGIEVYNGYQLDGGKIGYNTTYAAASTSGGILGGLAGAEGGAAIGAAIGVWFGGVGAIPGAAIGGVIGGIGGGLLGSSIGENSVDHYYGK